MRHIPAWVNEKLQPRLVVAFLILLALVVWNNLDLRKQRGAEIERTCQALNVLISQENEARRNGRVLIERLVAETSEPATPEEKTRLERFFDSIYYQLPPNEC